VVILETNSKDIVGKYEERFIRRLGEVAILLHLAKSPDGSHAYEMRSKASEILFEKRKRGAIFLQSHLDILFTMKELLSQFKADTSAFEASRKSLREKIDDCPIFKYNLRFKQMLEENYEINQEDLNYIDDIIEVLEESIKNMKKTSVIWSNISGIYPTIESLEKNGLIQFVRKDSEGDRLKKIYSITEIGRESLSRVMVSLMDISSFIFESERENIFHGTEGILSSRLLPFRKIFLKLSKDLSPEFKKKIHSFKGKSHGRPFIHMMMDQGLANPRLNVLISHPEMLDEHLNATESKEDRKMLKSFIRNRLLERRKKIDKLLERL